MEIKQQIEQSGIYRIVNMVSEATYIGSSFNVNRRLYHHKRALKLGIHGNQHLQRSWNKYGEQSFAFEELVLCARAGLGEREQAFMDAYIEHGLTLFNQVPSAKSRVGFSYTRPDLIGVPKSEEHRRKISLSHIGRVVSAETRAKLSASKRGKIILALRGLIKSAETRQKISANRKGIGHPHTVESRAKISKAQKGKKRGPMPMSQREKQSKAMKGRVFSAEHRAKIGLGNARRIFTPEILANMSAARKGKPGHPHTEESRAKIGLAHKGRPQQPGRIAAMNAARLLKLKLKREVNNENNGR